MILQDNNNNQIFNINIVSNNDDDDDDDAVDKSPENKYIRLSIAKSKIILRFIIEFGSCEHSLHTNYPINNNGTYSRSHFHPIKLIKDSSLISAYCDVLIDHPGAYQYYVNYKHRTLHTGYFIVEPRIVLPNNPLPLPLHGLRLLSMIPKWMGDITKWSHYLEQANYTNYNMIHFAPMQKSGISGSPFSIDNPLLFSDDLFSDFINKSNKEKLGLVKSTIDTIYSKHHILSLSDIVWNHVSNNSDFLYEHPEIGYNLHNSPHLMPAYELDHALIKLSSCMKEQGLPFDIQSEKDIDVIISYIENSIFPALKLYEYKYINIDDQVQSLHKSLNQKRNLENNSNNIQGFSIEGIDMMQLLNEKIVVNGHLGTRFHKSLDCEYAILLLFALNSTDQMTEEWIVKMCSEFRLLLEKFNSFHHDIYQQDVDIALRNIKDRLMYTHVAKDGPKLGPINEKNPLVESYFVHLTTSKEQSMQHPSGSMTLVCNGWLWDLDPLSDFAGPQSFAYLRRQVIVWTDCVKLRYGRSPKDNPWLWSQMRAYTETTARLFHGVRIDNCHSTPLHVAEYLLDAARAINPDLYVLAELFTGSPKLDHLFVSRLGIHALIREAMHSPDTYALSQLVEHYREDACFMDCTHDNETPFQRRTAHDTLPNAAVVAFSHCAVGSVKGYDEMYPRRLDLAKESRLYARVDYTRSGITQAKRRLLELHQQMLGYNQVNVSQEHDVVMIHRTHPTSEQGYLLIARTAFEEKGGEEDRTVTITLQRTHVQCILGYSLKVMTDETSPVSGGIQGLPSYLETLEAPPLIQDDAVQISVPSDRFLPGSIYVFETTPRHWSIEDTRLISSLPSEVTRNMNLMDCNVVLYKCHVEEKDCTGNGVYVVPGIGPLVYAGFQGFMSILSDPNDKTKKKRKEHLDQHLLQGTWAFDYLYQRLERYPDCHLTPLIDWLKSRVSMVKNKLPTMLFPKYFSILIETVSTAVYHHAISLMSPFVQNGSDFIQALAMTSVQSHGLVPSASLAPRTPIPTLAAGLHSFTEGAMRVWGRDVFISLRGTFLTTGQTEAAKRHLVAFAGVLDHGLIPNLLDSQRYPRYNSRDTVWYFMQALQDYYELVGKEILDEMVPMLRSQEKTIRDIMQDIMETHARGIHFREQLEEHMKDAQMREAGHQIDIEVDWKTGILVGGNKWNCGTWMDKMGESVKAGNQGHPATPRDGAPIEITGLLKSALRWINQLIEKGEYRWKGVTLANGEIKTFKQWEGLLQVHFERIYYVPQDPSKDKDYEIDSKIVHRRGIYKDVIRTSEPYTEYQLRPNFFIAMVVAPELFERTHARQALTLAKQVLISTLGVRTLDPADLQYRPYYRNAEDTDDFYTSKGRNYHQGPEWLWVMGYYLRAARYFDVLDDADMSKILLAHKTCLFESEWRGLPELTNRNGTFCNESCPNQTWSSATLLCFLYSESRK